METLIITRTQTKPEVVLDMYKGVFEIKGKSLPENAVIFYQPVVDWLKEYLEKPNPVTLLTFDMEYINSASSKKIFEIISMLQTPVDNGADIKVEWRYVEDDDDSLELGNELASLVNIPFLFRAYSC